MHALASLDTQTGTPAEPDDTSFRLIHRSAKTLGGLDYWMSLPNAPTNDAVPLVAVHGVFRDAKGQVTGFAKAAAATGRPVIAPIFDKTAYRRYQRVILGERADIALLTLLDQLERQGLMHARRFDLFGYSGGAQFAHRFALLYPHRIRRLTLAAAGWYTFPNESPYPYGLASPRRANRAWGPHVSAGLAHFLQLPIRVCVGEQDNRPDALTRSEPMLDQQQGVDRLSRATRWVAAMRHAAWARGMAADVQLHELAGCGHDFRECIRHGGLIGLTLTD